MQSVAAGSFNKPSKPVEPTDSVTASKLASDRAQGRADSSLPDWRLLLPVLINGFTSVGVGGGAGRAAKLSAENLGGENSSTKSAADHGHLPENCSLCPICSGIALIRAINPEVMQHAAAAIREGLAAVGALVTALEQQSSDSPSADDAAENPTADSGSDANEGTP